MQFNRLLKLTAFLLLTYGTCANSSDYPKTREERVAEEMGSIAGSEGIVFKPSHIKKDETKASLAANKKVNKFLWDSTRDVLKAMPTAVSDQNNGVVITDWYTTKDAPNYSFKIEIAILDDVISPDSIEVRVYEKKYKNGVWINEPMSSALSMKFADQIIRNARKVYIESTHQQKK